MEYRQRHARPAAWRDKTVRLCLSEEDWATLDAEAMASLDCLGYTASRIIYQWARNVREWKATEAYIQKAAVDWRREASRADLTGGPQ